MRISYLVFVTAVALFALLLAAVSALHAQEQQPAMMVGMPEYSIVLSGSPENPVIVNHSGKAVIGYDVEIMDANGRRSGVGQIMALSVMPAGIPDGDSAYVVGAAPVNPTVPMPTAARNASLEPIVRAALLSVVFADGQFVGTDKFGIFERFNKELKATAEVGKLAKTGAWDQVDVAGDEGHRGRNMTPVLLVRVPLGAPPSGEDPSLYIFRSAAASRLIEVRRFKGDAAANKLAEIYSSLPTLWK